MKNSSKENTKHTKQLKEIADYIKYKYGLCDWTATNLVTEIINLYNKLYDRSRS
jgi:hypothetical protein